MRGGGLTVKRFQKKKWLFNGKNSGYVPDFTF